MLLLISFESLLEEHAMVVGNMLDVPLKNKMEDNFRLFFEK